MFSVNLSEFANLTEAEMLEWVGCCEPVTVVDDAGETIKSNTYDLMINWYLLTVHRNMDKVMELPYLIDEVLECEVYNDAAHSRPINNYLKRFMPKNQHPLIVDKIRRSIYVSKAKLNNFLVAVTDKFSVSATAEDLLMILDHPVVQEIKKKILTREISIDEGEKEFIHFINTDEEISDSVFVILCRTKGVSVNQSFQTLIQRGTPFDLNDRIMPNSIQSSYFEGITNLGDSLADSRGSGKSLISNGTGLQNSEFLHRKGRLFASVMKDIDSEHDCGSHILIPMVVTDYELAMSLQGMYFKLKDERDEELKLATVEELNKIEFGSTIYLRNSAFCLSEDPTVPCGVCFGAMKTAIPYNVMTKSYANVGSWSGTAVMKDIGQGLLSTKHLIKNTSAKKFVPSVLDKDLISSDGNQIFIKESMVREGTYLVLNHKIIKELSDLRSLDSLEDVGEDKLSYFDSINLRYEDDDPMAGGKTEVQKPVRVSVSSRNSIMTPTFLDYVIRTGWEQIDRSLISIGLSKWNHTLPMFKLTNSHEDLNMLRHEIESFLAFTKRNKRWKNQLVTPELFGRTLSELWSLINTKFKGQNMVYSSILLNSLLARDPDNLNYEVMNGREPKYFANFNSCIANRGVATSFLYNSPQANINNPEWFLVKNRQDGMFESYFQEAVS